jgi:DNA-binding NtrC family response regulator
VRIISATNRDLEAAVESGEFRDDLFYRLAVVPIHLPQLRTRREEIPELALHLLRRHSQRLGVAVEGIHPEAMDVLLAYPWPGNIRELENVLERALVLSDGPQIGLEDLPESVRRPAPGSPGILTDTEDLSVKRQGARMEKHLIQLALDRTGWNRTQAADIARRLAARLLARKRNRVEIRQAFVTAENVNGLVQDAGFSGELGVLSIDVDGVDYWLWEAGWLEMEQQGQQMMMGGGMGIEEKNTF